MKQSLLRYKHQFILFFWSIKLIWIKHYPTNHHGHFSSRLVSQAWPPSLSAPYITPRQHRRQGPPLLMRTILLFFYPRCWAASLFGKYILWVHFPGFFFSILALCSVKSFLYSLQPGQVSELTSHFQLLKFSILSSLKLSCYTLWSFRI